VKDNDPALSSKNNTDNGARMSTKKRLELSEDLKSLLDNAEINFQKDRKTLEGFHKNQKTHKNPETQKQRTNVLRK
jgi:phage FluMu gp28-like protein